MRIGFFEIVLIIAVLLSIAVVWRWLRQGGSEDAEENEDKGEEGPRPSGGWRVGAVGLVLVLGGLGLLVIGYIIVAGLASLFIWATAILLLGVAFLLLSRH